MSDNHFEEKSGSGVSTYVIAALAAGIVGFLAIYVTFTPNDNEEPRKAVKSLKKLECPRPATTGNNELARFNCGDMVSFVINKNKPVLANISFKDADGASHNLESWRGKYVLLNIWATWCSPCRKEMPDLDKLKADLGSDKFDVVAISIDRGGAAKPKRFLEKIGVKNLTLYNDAKSRLIGPLRVIGMPTTLLIDPEGREIGRLTGPAHWASADAKRLIKSALN